MEAFQKVYQYLKDHHITYDVVEHEPAFHVSDLVDIKEPENSVGVKNLFLRDEKKQNFFLAVVPQSKRVDIKDIRRKIGCKPLSFADADFLWQFLRLTPGSVSPFGVLNDENALVTVILDEELFNYDKIGPHPNDNTKTIWLQPQAIKEMIERNGNPLFIIPVAQKLS
ncbi:prolyl-tRNA synthetase associated domain-containing protein [Clostridiales bacterium COT073_COT-073]|nr:prolyl-tRNA synthetase associated domain-containing protein [Clostridiales bacterium COT073_COT-073]